VRSRVFVNRDAGAGVERPSTVNDFTCSMKEPASFLIARRVRHGEGRVLWIEMRTVLTEASERATLQNSRPCTRGWRTWVARLEMPDASVRWMGYVYSRGGWRRWR